MTETPSAFEYKLLLIIDETNGNPSAFAISRLMHSRGWSCWSGGLYPALARLEQRGLLRSEWGVYTTPATQHRPRLYSITYAGRSLITNLPSPALTIWERFRSWAFHGGVVAGFQSEERIDDKIKL